MGAYVDRFEEWVGAGLLEAETAARLRQYEAESGRDEGLVSAHASPATSTPAEPPAPSAEQPHRALALVGEILGYFGAVLAITAISFLVSQTWSDIPTAGRVALVATLTAIVSVSAVFASRSPQDAGQRLTSALFLATVVCFGWLAWVSVDAADIGNAAAGLWVFAIATTAAAIIYALRRRALAQLTLLAGCVGTAAMMIDVLDATEGAWPGIVIGSVGAVWVTLAALGRLSPAAPALISGGLIVLYGVSSTVFDEATRGLTLAIGVALAVAMLSLAVMRRELITLLVPGAIGLLTLVPQLIEHFVGGAIATWSAVLVTGVALILIAVRMLRTPRTASSPAPTEVAPEDAA